MSKTIKLLGISGSIRSGSYNTLVLEALSDSIAGDAELTLFPLNDIPLYNQDIDGTDTPAAVEAFRAAIGAVDGLIISSPEYNYGISGVLKNALDWASRPYGKSTLTAKPVLTVSVSPAFTGGARAQAQVNEVLTAIGARLVLRPQSVVPLVHQKVEDGKFADETTLEFLKQGVADLIKEIRRPGSAISEAA